MHLCVTIPVWNEEHQLRNTVTTLHQFLASHIQSSWEITIAENGSTDRTPDIAAALTSEFENVRAVFSKAPGRGGALKRVWMETQADILSYMDADLSTDLKHFPALIAGLIAGDYDVATGSRLLNSSATRRSWKREVLSRCYNKLANSLVPVPVSDCQCGFKAITRAAAADLLPLICNENWFFDTELLVLAQHRGFRTLELPVRWIENRKTHVKMLPTSFELFKGLLRLRKTVRKDKRTAPRQKEHARHC